MRMTHDWMSTREKRQDIYDDKMGWEYYGVHVHCIAYILFSSDTEMWSWRDNCDHYMMATAFLHNAAAGFCLWFPRPVHVYLHCLSLFIFLHPVHIYLHYWNLLLLRVLFTVLIFLKLKMGLKNKACVLVTVGAALGLRDHGIKSNSFAVKPELTTIVSSILQAKLDQVDRSKKILEKGNEMHQAAEESLRMVVYLSCWGPNWAVCSILLSLVDQSFSWGAWNFHETRPEKIKACVHVQNLAMTSSNNCKWTTY